MAAREGADAPGAGGADAAAQCRVVYVVRHGESRYNVGMHRLKRLRLGGLVEMLGERDHGLSPLGVQQCLSLRAAILRAAAAAAAAAAEGGEDAADALALEARTSTLASPLCRAVLTAHLALPLGGLVHHVKALPEGRECCMVQLFARDSEGSRRSEIQSRVCSELERAAAPPVVQALRSKRCFNLLGGGGVPEALSLGAKAASQAEEALTAAAARPPEVDISGVSEEEWWTIGEAPESVKHRMGIVLQRLFDAACCKAVGASVFVGHSRALRMMFQAYAEEGPASIEPLCSLQKRLMENCAVVRLEVAGGSTVPRILGARFLFGTSLVAE